MFPRLGQINIRTNSRRKAHSSPHLIISIDGKTAKHSGSKSKGKLELSGCLVTIDAMGTQTKIAQLIQDNGADYCLALKENHKYLYQRVVHLFDQAEMLNWSGVEHDFHRTLNKGHGRTEIRRHWIMPVTELFLDEEKWAGLQQLDWSWRGFPADPLVQSIGLIESVRKIDGETTTNKRYYLNSFSSDAQLLARAERSHWGVENNLHWVLDVAIGEDDCSVHSDHAPENLSQLRKMALNLLSMEKTAKVGIANKRLKAAWDNQYLAKVLDL